MNLALMVVTDGREYFWETMKSFHETFNIDDFKYKFVIDDSLDPEFQRRLAMAYPEFQVESAIEKRGFGGAIRHGWSVIPDDVDYVFHLEDDFIFTEKPDLDMMIFTLEKYSYLLQMALLRGPVNNEERKAGGIIEQDPDSYTEMWGWHDELYWREHRKFFTTNPCLYRRSLIEKGWPDCEFSEGIFSIERFKENPEAKSAFWGSNDSGVWVKHIGYERKGTGY